MFTIRFELSSSESYAFTPPGHRILLVWGGGNVPRMPRTLRKGENAKALPINNVYMKKKPTMEAATSEFLHNMMNHSNPDKVHRTLGVTTGYKQPITPLPRPDCNGCRTANARRKGLRRKKVYSMNMVKIAEVPGED